MDKGEQFYWSGEDESQMADIFIRLSPSFIL